MHRLLAAAVLVSLIATGGAADTLVPVGLCTRVTQPPVIDGTLDDDAWRQCEVLKPFILLDASGPAKQQTEVRVCADTATLFIACELLEANMDKLKAQPTDHDISRLFSNDCVEIFIHPDPDTGEYFHLAASAAGSKYEAIATGGPIDWNPDWDVATSLGDGRWFLEAAIPLDEVRLKAVRPGQAIRFNVCREEMPNSELSSWSCTRGTFHNAALFGELVFYDIAPLAEAQMARMDAKLEAARGVSGDTPAFERAIEQLGEARKLAARKPLASADWQALRPRLAALTKEFDRLALAAREAMIWQVTPWRLPTHTDLPSIGTSETEELTVRLLRGEYETLAIAIANLGEHSISYHVTCTDLLRWHGNEELPSKGRIALREAIPLRTRSGGMVRDALPSLQTQANRMVIAGGENAVLWVTIHAEDLAPGSYVAGIDLLPLTGKERRALRLKIEVLPFDMPQTGAPYICTWAYLDHAETRGWLAKASRDLVDHYINVQVIHHKYIPWPTVDQAGNIIEPMDFGAFDERIKALPAGATYLLNLALHWFENLKTDLKPWTPEHKNAMRQWALQIRDQFRELGVPDDRWVWYPKDEPSTDKYAKLVRNFADTIHEADPKMAVYANPFSRTTAEQIRMMGEAIDVWCPNLSGLKPEDLAYMKQHGKRVWSYLVLSRLSNPYGAYRLPLWRAYDMGLTGFGHWAYDSVDGGVWDDSDGRVSDYATCYEGPDGPIPSVRLEALREGIEDYKCLSMLRQAAGEARRGGRPALADRAEQALGKALRTTLVEAGTRDTADRQRQVLQSALLALAEDTGKLQPAVLEDLARPLPACLTGNGGPRVSNLHTGGYYTYSAFPTHTWNEQSGVTAGKLWFRGEDAAEGKQAESKTGGDLVDGSWFYRRQFVNLWIWSPHAIQITFDLMKAYDIARVDVFAGGQTNETNRVQSLAILVSETGEEGSFEPVGEIADCPTAELGPQGEFQIPVARRARYVRVDAAKKAQTMTIAEVRIWGTDE